MTRVLIESRFVSHFVDPDVNIGTFSEKEWQQKMGALILK